MMFVTKYTEQRFQYTSEEESLERTHHEDSCNHWKDSSADFGWLVARSDRYSEAVDGNRGVRKAICFSAGRCIGSYESFDSKLALRQRRYVLVQGILVSQQPRFKSLRLLCMEYSWKDHKQVLAFQCDIIKDRYWGNIRRHG